MVALAKGTWFRRATYQAGNTLHGVTSVGPRWVAVGESSGAPLIMTVETADLDQLAPTFTTRTPAGTDPLRDVDYISAEDRCVACGLNGRIEYSQDKGLTWSTLVLTGTPNMAAIVGVTGDALSRFIVAGTGSIWGQNNSAVWSARYSGARDWVDVAHRTGAGWVVVASDGYASQSATGGAGTFAGAYQLSAYPLHSVAANASYFVAVDNFGWVYRSTTGLSGSWTKTITRDFNPLVSVQPMASDNDWALVDIGKNIWWSDDNGATWAETGFAVTDAVERMANGSTYALAVGADETVHVSTDATQDDYVTSVVAPTPPLAFGANADMAGDAVRRLVTQFRSGGG